MLIEQRTFIDQFVEHTSVTGSQNRVKVTSLVLVVTNPGTIGYMNMYLGYIQSFMPLSKSNSDSIYCQPV